MRAVWKFQLFTHRQTVKAPGLGRLLHVAMQDGFPMVWAEVDTVTMSDAALLRRYLRMWHRLDWYGLRSWLYAQALHSAVHERKPFSCQAVPPRGTGGYDHWHCQLRRRHDGMHRFNNYVWGDVGGEDLGHVVHAIRNTPDLPPISSVW